MSGTIEQKITELVKPLIESMDVQLWGVRYRGGHDSAVLQIFIEKEDGITADMCADISNMLSPALDTADIIAPSYILEVSSPGLDRILFTKEQATKYIGSNVKVELKIPTLGRKKLDGILKQVQEDSTVVVDDKVAKGDFPVAFSNISTMRLVPDFSNK